jgi:hypothetical protein
MRRLLPLVTLSLLSACSLLPGQKSPDPSESSSNSTTTTSSSQPKATTGSAKSSDAPAAAAAFTDKDEGSMGPMQDKHPTEIVFANVAIDKKSQDESVLVTTTTLDKPLFVRAYMDRTPAHTFHDVGQSCSAQRFLRFRARLDGVETSANLYTMPMSGEMTFPTLRSKTITGQHGADPVSIVPTTPFTWNEGDNVSITPFTELVAQMKPGKNVVTVELEVGCEGSTAKDGKFFHTVSKGTITFDVKAGDLAAFAKRVGPKFPPSFDPASEARVKPDYVKSLVAGAKLLAFAADRTEVNATVQKKTRLHTALKNLDGTCTYQVGDWIEPYKGAGQYETGHWDGTGTVVHRFPCP